MNNTTTPKPLTVTILRLRGYVSAVCECGWEGDGHSTRTIKGIDLARDDAREHATAHTRGSGFFHPRRGWVSCDSHPAVTT